MNERQNVGKFAAVEKDRALDEMRERGWGQCNKLVSTEENCVISSFCVVTSVKWCG